MLINTILLALSMTLSLMNMVFFMSAHKRRQVDLFHEDHSREDKMIEKIDSVSKQSKLHSTLKRKIRRDKSHNEMSYKAFINLYFACFMGQGLQMLLILFNWGSSFMVTIYLLYPLLGVGVYGHSSIFYLFAGLLIFLFTLVTYFYALYLKTKVEAQIIEDFVHRHKHDIF